MSTIREEGLRPEGKKIWMKTVIANIERERERENESER